VKAVIFDCDGVLVDSEPLAEASWSQALARYGHTATAEQFEDVRGRTADAGYEYFAALVELPPVAEFRLATREYWDAHLDELTAFPDAVEMVRALAGDGIPLAVASSSRRAELDMKLARFDLTSYFDVTVAGDEVPFVKPAPDLFLAAAQGLRIDPADCLAIDDAEVGADAAVAAGMRAVRLTRNAEFSARHPVVSSLDADLIEHWLGVR
jgi:HAD superfamily hydrolase (TIGR01509 family)